MSSLAIDYCPLSKMHIRKKLDETIRVGKPTFSFEFFPPKTEQGVQNLYDRMDRMYALGPEFIDITWNAGGVLSNLTCEMVNVAQTVYGLETCMHLTCVGMGQDKVDSALEDAYKAGCTNILALRGDPPRGSEKKEEAKRDGFLYAKDLIKHIKKKYGDHFDIGVAGYPEGCEDNKDPVSLMQHLKEKIDVGGTFIVTQMFYDVDNFLEWVQRCRDAGIDAPIIPGIMPITSYESMLRRAKHMEARVPIDWLKKLEPVKNDDAAVRQIGRDLVAGMCRKIINAGILSLHFYTMNLEQGTRMILQELELTPTTDSPLSQSLPWRQSLGLNRREENVRPIFWSKRHQSYVARSQNWDDFPNGRWGDSRSPAYGAVDQYGVLLKGTNEQNIKLYGRPSSIQDVVGLFVKYLEGKLPSLPWSDSPLTSEADSLTRRLIEVNKRGFLTVNSQPAVGGVKSTDTVHGWGPKNGYIFKKSYLEFFTSPELVKELIPRLEKNPSFTYYAVNKTGDLQSNASNEGPNAVTWGVFPGREIIQPTIVETISFLAWKDEAFRLGLDWSQCYDPGTQSRHLIEYMMENWYLVNIGKPSCSLMLP